MHVAFLSTYPPRACGLATFTSDLRTALAAHPNTRASVASIVEHLGDARTAAHPPEVKWLVDQFDAAAFASLSYRWASLGVDVASIQHEYGIFGGRDGAHLLALLERSRQPLVTTFHTVLPRPSEGQLRVLREVAAGSRAVVVMSETARTLLREVYHLPDDRIAVIPHGVHAVPTDRDALRQHLGMNGRMVWLTFGLLGPGKGVEFVLEALPEVVRKNPDVLYVVLGATHPSVKRQQGEAYRERLQALVEARGLANHVRFVDQYVSQETLGAYLAAADGYVSPYPGMDQICSGTLAYAIGAGKAIVSTPYLYARELLAKNTGLLVPYGDGAALTQALNHVSGDADARLAFQARAAERGRPMLWSHVAEQYDDLLRRVVRSGKARTPAQRLTSPNHLAPNHLPVTPREALVPREARPQTSARRDAAPSEVASAEVPYADALRQGFGFLAALTDEVGLIQHTVRGIPDRHHGYSADDVARALVVVADYDRHVGDPRCAPLIRTYLSYLHHAQVADGRFCTFMGYDRRMDTERLSEDTVGRVLWGLGALVATYDDPAAARLAYDLMERALAVDLTHPRAIGYALHGVARALERWPADERLTAAARTWADALVARYEAYARDDWHWFDNRLTYACAGPSEALLCAYGVLGEERYLDVGLATLAFALEQNHTGAYLSPVGNRGWLHADARTAPVFDQQPIEAGYLASACTRAYRITNDPRYLNGARDALAWFFGRNCHQQPLYNPATGGCYDALTPDGVNENQGAESIFAMLLALLSLHDDTPDLTPKREADLHVTVAAPAEVLAPPSASGDGHRSAPDTLQLGWPR